LAPTNAPADLNHFDANLRGRAPPLLDEYLDSYVANLTRREDNRRRSNKWQTNALLATALNQLTAR
jgi:hypothetical protein